MLSTLSGMLKFLMLSLAGETFFCKGSHKPSQIIHGNEEYVVNRLMNFQKRSK